MKAQLTITQFTLAALCALALTPAAGFAGSATKTAKEYGIIKSVDANSHQMVIADHKTKKDETFQWNDRTKFAEHGKTAGASALKAGVPVRVIYQPGPGTPVLERVTLTPRKEQQHASTSLSSHANS
jgi:Cu/Ag efflux protein CusF